MKTKRIYFFILICLMFFSCNHQTQTEDKDIPHLEKKGTATQFIVDGKPFIALCGELTNNAATSLDYMKPVWPLLTQNNLNSVIAGISWAMVEPEEGTFVDGKWIPGRRLAGDDTAQRNNLRFGSGYNILRVTMYSFK